MATEGRLNYSAAAQRCVAFSHVKMELCSVLMCNMFDRDARLESIIVQAD